MPPTYLFLAVCAAAALHFGLPLARLIPRPWNLLGVVPLLAGLIADFWGSGVFNRRQTTIKPFEKPSALVVDGLYRLTRHPMYVGMLLVVLGVVVLLGTVGPALVLVPFAIVLEVFMRLEERAMREAFGEEYDEYAKRVRRWL
jgi:protein-S-isoprenylcysteine O-methyltransferase Ste14